MEATETGLSTNERLYMTNLAIKDCVNGRKATIAKAVPWTPGYNGPKRPETPEEYLATMQAAHDQAAAKARLAERDPHEAHEWLRSSDEYLQRLLAHREALQRALGAERRAEMDLEDDEEAREVP